MSKDVEDLLVDMVKSLNAKVDDIKERLIRLEERTSRKASLYGLLGGLIPAIGFLIYLLVSK